MSVYREYSNPGSKMVEVGSVKITIECNTSIFGKMTYSKTFNGTSRFGYGNFGRGKEIINETGEDHFKSWVHSLSHHFIPFETDEKVWLFPALILGFKTEKYLFKVEEAIPTV